MTDLPSKDAKTLRIATLAKNGFMSTNSNPYESSENSSADIEATADRDVSILWFTLSVGVALTASNAIFATSGIWYRFVENPILGSMKICILGGLCTLLYAPGSLLLRRLFRYRYSIFIAFVSGVFFAVGDRLMRSIQIETGINSFVINCCICLACTLPIELAFGILCRLAFGSITSRRDIGS